MSKRVQILGLTSAVLAATTGFARELIVNTTSNVLTVHDGATVGGIPLAKQDLTNCSAATTSVAGLLSAADKLKLDGIATGATALSLSSTLPAAETSSAAGTIGVGTTAARSDHVHPMPAISTMGSSGALTDGTGTLLASHGGTGQTTLAIHGVVIGNAANAVNVTAVGTTGQVLTGVTGADPVWASASSGLVKVASVTGAGATSLELLNCFSSTYNNYKLFIHGLFFTAGADPYLQFGVSGTYKTAGSYFTQGWFQDNGTQSLHSSAALAGLRIGIGNVIQGSVIACMSVECFIAGPMHTTNNRKQMRAQSNLHAATTRIACSDLSAEWTGDTVALTDVRLWDATANNITGTLEVFGVLP